MASLLGWLGNTAKKVEQQVNPFDNGATFSHPAAPARPVPQQQHSTPQAPPMANRQAPIQLGQMQLPRAPLFNSPVTPAIHASIGHDLTHNPVTNFIGNQLKATAASSPIVQGIEHGTQGFTKAITPPTVYAQRNGKTVVNNGKPVYNPDFIRYAQNVAMGTVGGKKPAGLSTAELKSMTAQNFTPDIINKAHVQVGGKLDAQGAPIPSDAKPPTPPNNPYSKNGTGRPLTPDPKLLNIKLNNATDPVRKAELQAEKAAKSKTQGVLPTAPIKVNALAATKREFVNKVNALRQIDTPSAHKAADAMHNVYQTEQDLRAGYRNTMSHALNLNPTEYNNLGNVIEHGAQPMNRAVSKAVPGAKAAHQQALTDYLAAGGKTGTTPNYFSRDYSNVKPGTTPNVPDPAFGLGVKPSFFGNFDRSRMDVPGYHYSKEATQKYLNGAASKTAQTAHFGVNGKTIKALVNQIGNEGGDAKFADTAVQNFLRVPDGGLLAKPAGAVRGAFGVARLGKASISHLGQAVSNIPQVTRLVDLPQGIARSLTIDGRDLAKRADVNNPANIHGMTEQSTGVGNKIVNKGTAPFLTPLMKANRVIAANSSKSFGKYLAKKGADGVPFEGGTGHGELKRLGVTGDIGKVLTPPQEEQLARGVTNESMFNPSRANTPVRGETTGGRMIGQYREAYQRKQGGLIYNKVIGQAKQGNFRPAAKLLATAAPVAAGTLGVKAALPGGHKEGAGGKALDVAASLGGLPTELAVQAARYGPKNIVGTASGMIAPAAGEAVKLGDAIQRSIKNKSAKPVEGYGAGLAGPAGPYLSQKVDPYKQPPKAVTPQNLANASVADVKAQDKKDIAAYEKNNKAGGYGLTKTSTGKYIYQTPDGTHVSNDLQSARDAIAMDTFKRSGADQKTVGSEYYYRDQNGDPKHQPLFEHQYNVVHAVATDNMAQAKDNQDYAGWNAAAQTELTALQTKRDHYNKTSQQDKIAETNKSIESLKKDMNKYAAYGGAFTKGSNGSSSKGKAAITAGFKTASATKLSPPKGITVKKLATPAFKTTGTKKLSVPKISTSYHGKKL